ncbi:MAG: hypothetical protein KHX35_10805 [Sutterella wadsworthensis]|nr:hypothetical protein [Sutterella wadsworthensis]
MAPTKVIVSLIGLALLAGCVEKEDPAEVFETALVDYYKAEGCVGFSPTHGYPAPVVKGGKTLCEVTFEIKPTNVAEWAKHPEVVKAMSMLRRSLKADADKPKKVKKLMVLSDQGWIVKDR